MELKELEKEGLLAIDSLLKEWESTYLTAVSPSEPKWIYYTRTSGLSETPTPHVRFTTIFSQPTQTHPVPRATASIHFVLDATQKLTWQFEAQQTVHSLETVGLLGNPAKRLTEIVKSKETVAQRFARHLDNESVIAGA